MYFYECMYFYFFYDLLLQSIENSWGWLINREIPQNLHLGGAPHGIVKGVNSLARGVVCNLHLNPVINEPFFGLQFGVQ